MGAGGTNSTPSTSVTCNGSNVEVVSQLNVRNHGESIKMIGDHTYIAGYTGGTRNYWIGNGNVGGTQLSIMNERNGNVVIQTGSNTMTMNTTSTTFNNSVTASSFTAQSDYRVKKDIKPLKLEEYSVDNLNPVYFKFKDSEKESIGLIAHELQEHYPFLVECEKNGKETQSVNYNGLIGILIKEIQELKNRIKILENKIEII
jgi:hypothetical protein